MNKKAAGTYTNLEICGQPALWRAVYELILKQEADIKAFLEPIFQRSDLHIVLSGAGSSAFIGETARGLIQEKTGNFCQAIPTTDLVTHSTQYFHPHRPTLLISFARSGNSPESVQAVTQANKLCREIYHLVITCNKEGALLKKTVSQETRTYCLLLPEKAHDKSLAMTGSFTSMLLSVLLLADYQKIRANREIVACIIAQADSILAQRNAIKLLGAQDFERVVFLGSGPMVGIARECQLKLQELTDGEVICKYDSFLGFRHGPKVVVNPKTLLVYLFSEDQHVFQYERDLALEFMESDRIQGTIHLGQYFSGDPHECLSIRFSKKTKGYHIIPATLIGQLLGFHKSLELGFDPDNPSISGAINRVVQGVTLYEGKPSYNDFH